MMAVAANPPASLRTIAQAAAEAIKDGKVFEFELYMLHEVWDGAVEGLDFLKAVVMGEFADHRSTAVLITEALASFIPGVAIVQSVRDATAISLRLIYHPEKRSDWMEWVLLAVNLVVICLPAVLAAVQAVIGLAAAGVGAVVGGVAGAIEGSELGALIRLVMLMMAKGGAELAEVVAMMGRTTKGNIVKLLRELKLDKLREPLIDAVKAIVSKCAAALKWVGKKLTDLLEHILESSGAGWASRHWTTAKAAIDEGVRPLRELIAKMADLEKRFYGFQADAIKALPDALAHIQARLTQLLTQQVGKDTHLVAAGVRAEKPAAAVLLPQKVHPRVDQPLTRLEEQMPAKAKPKAKPAKAAEVSDAKTAEPKAKAADTPSTDAAASKDPAPIPDKPKVPEAPEDSHANVKRKTGADNTAARPASGLTQAQFDAIVQTPRGSRPDPTTYLSPDYVDAHLAQFSNGTSKIAWGGPTAARPAVGPPGGTFVMPSDLADSMLANASSVSELEGLLSLKPGELGPNPVRIDIPNPVNLRMPSGNELGANTDWIPGGFTGGGIPEATIDPAVPGTFTVHPIIFNGP